MKRTMKRHDVVQPQDPSYRLIPLTQNQNATVDTEDYDFLCQWNWSADFVKGHDKIYAVRCYRKNGKTKKVYMHAAIIGDAIHRDHCDGNGLNNRRSNLRAATPSQNLANRPKQRNNSSGFKGVRLVPSGRWVCKVKFMGNVLHEGTYDAPELAALAYDRKAIELWGEFAQLNFPIASAGPEIPELPICFELI